MELPEVKIVLDTKVVVLPGMTTEDYIRLVEGEWFLVGVNNEHIFVYKNWPKTQSDSEIEPTKSRCFQKISYNLCTKEKLFLAQSVEEAFYFILSQTNTEGKNFLYVDVEDLT